MYPICAKFHEWVTSHTLFMLLISDCSLRMYVVQKLFFGHEFNKLLSAVFVIGAFDSTVLGYTG